MIGSTLYWLAKALVLPPLNCFALVAGGLVLRRRHPRAGRRIAGLGLALLYLFSTPLVGGLALGVLEPPYADPLAASPPADAIVILGGGVREFAPEFGASYLKPATLQRLRYGAWLHRRTDKPLLVSGGRVTEDTPVEAHAMRATLVDEFRVPVAWVEDASRDTHGNALESHRILTRQGIRRIYLVTHAAHMQRARAVFESVGFEVVPAATVFTRWKAGSLIDLLPSMDGLTDTHYAFYEGFGYVWYKLRSRM